MLCTVWILFLWASTLSRPCHSCHDGREVIVVPICLHNKLRARHRVTNRSMSYSTYSKVGKEKNKQTAAIVDSIKDPAISLWVSCFIILLLTHCHGALWFVLLQNYSNCSTCFSGPTLWGRRLWSWTAWSAAVHWNSWGKSMLKWSDLFRGPISLLNKMLQLQGKPLWGVKIAMSKKVWEFQHQMEVTGFCYSMLLEPK